MWVNYSTDEKNFTGHMFNIKLEKKPYKMSFKALPVKIQWSKNQQRRHNVSPPEADRVKGPGLIFFYDFIIFIVN